MKLITCMGGVWKLSETQYRKLVRNLESGGTGDLDVFGKYLGTTTDFRDLQQDAEEERQSKEQTP